MQRRHFPDFHTFFEDWATFRESPIGQFVQLRKSFGFGIIHPAPFCSGDLWGYVGKEAWLLPTVAESASASRSSNRAFTSVFCFPRFESSLKLNWRCRDLQRNTFWSQKGTILNADKVLVRVTSSWKRRCSLLEMLEWNGGMKPTKIETC